MLRRLVKYDMRAISRVAVPMFIASWIVSFLCCAVLYFTFGFAEELNSMFSAFMITGSLYLVGMTAISVMLSLVAIVVAFRYYKSVFTDEGYLNMAIPVTRKAFLDSKIISSVVWSVLAAITTGTCVFVSLVLPMILYDTSLISEAISFIKSELHIGEGGGALGISTLVFGITVSVLRTIKDVGLIIGAITLGASLFKRFKFGLSVVLYFAISFAEELFTDAVKMLTRVITLNSPWTTLILNTLFEILIVSTVFVAMYCVSLYLLKKRFNIE